MPIDVSGFVGKEETYPGLYQAANANRQRQYQQQRLAMQQEGRNQATSKFFENALSDKHYLTGTEYDPYIAKQLQDTTQQAQQLASKGASIADINMAIAPNIADLNEYHTKATLLDSNIKNYVEKMKGTPGYDTAALMDTAKKMAFHQYDEKNGTWGNIKPIGDVDPSTNYVEEALKQHPELIANEGGLLNALKGAKQDVSNPETTTEFQGRKAQIGYKSKIYPFQNIADTKDEHGNPTGVETSFEIAHDGGKPIADENGQPMKVVPDNVYSNFVNRPGIKPFLDAQVKTVAKQLGQPVPPEYSPQFQLLQKHILYNWLDDNAPKDFSPIYKETETAPAVHAEMGNDPKALDALNRYHDATTGHGDYYIPSEHMRSGKAVKTNAVEAIGHVMNNDPDYLNGETKEVDTPDGKVSAVDVTPFLPNGGLKSGKGSNEAYKNVSYSPETRSLYVDVEDKTGKKDKDGKYPIITQTIPESKVGLFVSRMASANGVPPDKVNGILSSMGYKGGKFANAANPSDATAALQKDHEIMIEGALNNDEFSKLQGLRTPQGTIQKIDERKYLSYLPGVDKYSVTVKKPDGATVKQTFATKEALSAFVKQSAPAKATAKPSDKDAEDLINKYLPKK